MSKERVIPQPASTDLPTWRILIDGSEISSEIHLMSIYACKEVNRIPRAKIELLDGDLAEEDFQLSNSDQFVPGKSIEILAGYHSDDTTIFKGVITGHKIQSRAGRPSKLTVDCRDTVLSMAQTRKSACFQSATDSEIIEGLISGYGLQSDVTATDVTHQEMVQYHASDWDFVVERAEANGHLVVVDDGKVTVGAADTSQEPELSLLLGSTILEFEAEIDARSQLADVMARTWSYSDQQKSEETAASPDVTESGNLQGEELADALSQEKVVLLHGGSRLDSEMQAWADGRLARSRLAKVIGRVKCQGFAAIKPGQMLELDGVGDRFNGKVFVTAVSQQFDVNNWETDIQFGLRQTPFSHDNGIPEVQASGLLPPVHGLHVGIVTQLQDDPDGEDRIRVRMPMVDPDGDGVWSRVATLDAGNERGSFFRPEIDDEVLLGFLNDDPRDPVVLGMMNSSAKPAPITASDDNHIKGFVTRSNMKLIFDDDAVSVTVETPNGNKAVLSDQEGSILFEDENGNRIELNADGITINSPGEINIEASKDLNQSGMNVNSTANAQFKAEGSAGAELSSSAVATIKGSLVQIN